MASAVFKLSDINTVMRELQGDVDLVPTLEHVFMENLYPDSLLLDEAGRTKEQAEEAGDKFWPDSSRMISSKVPRALIMKNDKGLYICNNLKSDMTPFRRGTIAFAQGCNPVVDNTWQVQTMKLAPGELHQIIPIADVVSAIRAHSETLVVEIKGDTQNAA